MPYPRLLAVQNSIALLRMVANLAYRLHMQAADWLAHSQSEFSKYLAEIPKFCQSCVTGLPVLPAAYCEYSEQHILSHLSKYSLK